MPARVDLTGRRYGKLVVQGDGGRHPTRGIRLWRCLCDCGKVTAIAAGPLNNGNSTSCGCVRLANSIAARKTHGETFGGKASPEYAIWQAMLRRCLTPSHKQFPLYGGRGITVCDRWRKSFENFLADMGRKPSPSHSIDRIDNDAGYCKENCRWATQKVQVNNRRNTIVVSHQGKTRNLLDWSAALAIPYKTLHNRWKKGERPPVLFAPSRPRGRNVAARK